MSYTAPSITASGVNFAGLQAKGCSGHLEALIGAQAATADPTVAPTLAASGTGNTLPAATYAVRVSETNGIGETLSIAAAATQAVTLGQALVVTFQSLKSGNTARNVYVSAVGTSGPWTLAGSGITAGTYSITAPLPADSRASVALPAVNSTGLSFVDANGQGVNKALELVRSMTKHAEPVTYQYLRQVVTDFLEGDAVTLSSAATKLRHAHTAFLMLATLCSEIGTLMDANPGTISTAAVGPNRKSVRTFP
jgi:hypothetical protein